MVTSAFTVADLMSSPVVVIRADESVARAMLEMSFGGFRHLPVVDETGHLVGVISTHDVVRLDRENTRQETPVSRIMSRTVHQARTDTSAFEAVNLMLEHRIGCLPVVDERRQVIGVVTQTDFLKVARQVLGTVEVQHVVVTT